MEYMLRTCDIVSALSTAVHVLPPAIKAEIDISLKAAKFSASSSRYFQRVLNFSRVVVKQVISRDVLNRPTNYLVFSCAHVILTVVYINADFQLRQVYVGILLWLTMKFRC